MKEFNRWWKISHSHFGPIPKDCSKSAWQAALEWTESLYKKYDMDDWDRVACTIKKDIKEELDR